MLIYFNGNILRDSFAIYINISHLAVRKDFYMKKDEHTILPLETIDEASRIFKALSDPTRIKILYLLSQEECSVNHMVEVLEMTQSAVSHQLSLLRNLRLVKYRREGNTFYYTYDDEHVIEILNQVLSHIDHT